VNLLPLEPFEGCRERLDTAENTMAISDTVQWPLLGQAGRGEVGERRAGIVTRLGRMQLRTGPQHRCVRRACMWVTHRPPDDDLPTIKEAMSLSTRQAGYRYRHSGWQHNVHGKW